MSRCSKKCNEIKAKIDSISGLDDNFIYYWLEHLDEYVYLVTLMIKDYADQNKLNGTIFK